MSETNMPSPQGKQVDPGKLIMRLKNQIADQAVQIAMLETYIGDLEQAREENSDAGDNVRK